MKHRTLLLLLLATILPSMGAELNPDVQKRAKQRIESLLGNRRGASSAPENVANPFVLPQTAPTNPVEQSPTGDLPLKGDILTRLGASLKVSGYIQTKGVPYLTINRQTYRENDLIPVREGGGSVTFLLLKKITEADFILELDGVELLQKHTVK